MYQQQGEVEKKRCVLTIVYVQWTHLDLRNDEPVLMLRRRPRAVSTPTTSLAMMLSQTMERMKARDTMTASMAQWGGLLGLSSTAINTDITRPGMAGHVCGCERGFGWE